MVPFVFTSCEKDEDVSFDKSLLTGKWVQGTVHYKYLANGTGGTWDTADDVTEAEAQSFTWTLDGDQLTHIHAITKRNSLGIVVRRNVPKVYTPRWSSCARSRSGPRAWCGARPNATVR